MGLSIVTVDAFTDARFAGNPAAVCVLPPGKSDKGWMQKVAREMNLSETAFLRVREAGIPTVAGSQRCQVLRLALVYANR